MSCEQTADQSITTESYIVVMFQPVFTLMNPPHSCPQAFFKILVRYSSLLFTVEGKQLMKTEANNGIESWPAFSPPVGDLSAFNERNKISAL